MAGRYAIPYCTAHIEVGGQFQPRLVLAACRIAWATEEVKTWIEVKIASDDPICVGVEEAVDHIFEFPQESENAALDTLLCEIGKEVLDSVEPEMPPHPGLCAVATPIGSPASERE
jgi:hypothetical protein